MSNTIAEKMQIIHDPKRPTVDDYIHELIDDFIELHGDRFYGEDAAICAGIGTFEGMPVTIIGHRKGKDTESNLKANFAMANPEGYRKALRLAHQAEKFARPVICFVDTPGAFPGVGAEERGQGEAIARCLAEFMNLRTPVVSLVTGEGGSGGAIALAVADRVLMLENAIYSVISPRGAASLLWKDASREMEAAQALRITAPDLLEMGIIEDIVSEGATAAALMRNVRKALQESIQMSYQSGGIDQMLQKRYEKFRKIGVFSEIK